MDSWVAFWLTDFSEPPANPLYLVLFVVFVLVSSLALYTFRGIPNWIIESRESRLLRLFSANIAVVATAGACLLVLQSMSVPVVSRRIWLAVIVVVLALHFLGLLVVVRFFLRRPRSPASLES
ncbi:MAG TPA: hypothetical protein VHX16_03565 [Chloroflexota bacterium]|jgi:hypothetical protein|nr:hypothetical protein [Chloroflexota bacterium]